LFRNRVREFHVGVSAARGTSMLSWCSLPSGHRGFAWTPPSRIQLSSLEAKRNGPKAARHAGLCIRTSEA
jgi:hypothetical protein